MSVRAGIDLALQPKAAFDTFVEELTMALARLGMHLDPVPHGYVTEGQTKVGRVISWRPGEAILLEWRPAHWKPDQATKLEVRFEPIPEGTQLTLHHDGWGDLFNDPASELAGWFASEVAAPLLHATGPTRFGDWLTDRIARRPSGAQARQGYRDPLYHRPNFKAILNSLKLTPRDYFLEIGCGGGALLHDALQTGCRAAAIDHSPEMVNVACEVNEEAIKTGRLKVLEAEADEMPFPNEVFTSAASTNVFGFLPDPIKALTEVHRVLAKGGRLVVFTVSKEMRGTMAAPEPMASRIRFYEDVELEQLAHKAGFVDARVERPDLEPFARELGMMVEDEPSSSARGQLLLCRKG